MAVRRGTTRRSCVRSRCSPISRSGKNRRAEPTRQRPMQSPRDLLKAMFDAAIAAAQTALCLPAHLPAPPRGRLIVIGAGKASAAMAKAVEDNWRGPLSGLVVTRYGYSVPCKRIEIFESAHPVPDAASVTASRRLLETVAN